MLVLKVFFNYFLLLYLLGEKKRKVVEEGNRDRKMKDGMGLFFVEDLEGFS